MHTAEKGENMQEVLRHLMTAIDSNLWIAPVIALVSGVLTSLMPCSLSTVPLIIGYVGGTEVADEKKRVRKALYFSILFALGSAVTFCVLGVLAVLIADFVENVCHAGWIMHIVMGLLLVLMALQMWDVINIIPTSTSLMEKNHLKGAFGVFVAGIIAGLFASHCALPAVVMLLGVAAANGGGNVFFGFMLLLLFSIGHGVLSVVAGTSVGFVQHLFASKKYKVASKVIKIVIGIIILLVAIYLIWNGVSEGILHHAHVH